jgi:mono/diheme cytochrome c family protein
MAFCDTQKIGLAPVRLSALAVFSALAASVLLPPAARADDVAWGQRIWHDKAECETCHGWAGDGMGGSLHHQGKPPSLRTTQLTRDQIRMTIQCGRPGTAMPYFDRFAYTDKRCYGMTAEFLEKRKMMPDRAQTTLQPDEIDALADYVATKLKGAGPVTRAECHAYFDAKASRCDVYPEREAHRQR